MITKQALESLEKNLPDVFARKEVGRLLGGAIAPGTLANLGKDGPDYFFINRNAVYEKRTFLDWLAKKMKLPG